MGGQGQRARASFTGVSSQLSDTSPVWDISRHHRVTSTQNGDESRLERWSGVPPPLSFDPEYKNEWSCLLGSEMGEERERSHIILHVGLSVLTQH